MKLISLYSNFPKKFLDIDFNSNLNVVFARVKEPNNPEVDSHNLGKTFLIQVIDFILLGNITKNHPFRINDELFGEFVFYLEIQNNDGNYIQVRRSVSGVKTIYINTTKTSIGDARELENGEWDYPKLSIDTGLETLNKLLNLDAIYPYGYRKGLGYILRSQSDYDDEFRISKFAYGKDIDWKPYLGMVLGFDHDVIKRKYEIDYQIEEHKKYIAQVEQQAGSKAEEYDEIRGQIEIISDRAESLRLQVDKFSFYDIEEEINEDAILRLESQISDLNNQRYLFEYELREIEKSLESDYKFDVNIIRDVFQETETNFPDTLVKEYEDLVEFNRRLSLERATRLSSLKSRLNSKIASIDNELIRLDTERSEALEILTEKETIVKYQALQKKLLGYEEEMNDLRQQLSSLDLTATPQKQIDELQKERVEVIDKINSMIRTENVTHSNIRRSFSNCVNKVINVNALLSVSINQKDNLEFSTRTLDRDEEGRETSESSGTSYKKLLCACFDLSVLRVHSDRFYYRFVYHDGIFEGLDNRKKASLLELIREYSKEYGIQYILTVIDSDLPRDGRDQKLFFSEAEIIRELNDEGENGRLFRMKAF